MGFASHMNQVCDVMRQTQSGVDAYGQPLQGWTIVQSGLRCRIEALSGKDILGSGVPEINGQVVTHRGFFPGTESILPRDKIVSGLSAYVVEFADRDVGAAGRHQECLLSEVV